MLRYAKYLVTFAIQSPKRQCLSLLGLKVGHVALIPWVQTVKPLKPRQSLKKKDNKKFILTSPVLISDEVSIWIREDFSVINSNNKDIKRSSNSITVWSSLKNKNKH